MAMPGFIGIGAQKAGTTWLYDMLAQNPSVWLPPLKEVHYFDFIDAPEARRIKRAEHIAKVAVRLERDDAGDGEGAGQAAFLRSLLGRPLLTPEWYGSIFDHPKAEGRITGEITPAYLELDEPRLQVLADMLPTTKFVLVVREPLARALSQLRMAVGRAKDEVGEKHDWSFFLGKIRKNTRGNYQSAIPLWRKMVGAERLLVLPFSMVRDEPAELLRRVEDFIGARRFGDYKALNEQVHKTKDVTVPDWVIEEVEAMAAPQKDYLIEAFGEEFYQKTR